MVTHPSVQEKARAEVDRVIGIDCLPTYEHREQLPYIDALIKECMRWGVILPMGMSLMYHTVMPCDLISLHQRIGVPHQALEDDVYRGYHIPRGALVMANSWYAYRCATI